MSELPKSRPVRLDDLFDDIKPLHNNYSNHRDITIQKNQKEFGNRKRIKP